MTFLSTYGDNVGVQYAESILNFSRNCDYAMFIVDHLLDILTGNEHRKTSHYIAEQKMLRKEDELLENTYNDLEVAEESSEKDKQVKIGSLFRQHSYQGKGYARNIRTVRYLTLAFFLTLQTDQIDSNQVDFDSLKSLNSDLGIDMSFLDTLKKEYDNVKESATSDQCSNSKTLPKFDEKTSKELQNTIQKNAELINELKVSIFA